jgi:inhibitor of cysteine peptidase
MPARYTRQDRDVTATVGEEFIIALEANPTTGYRWEPEYDRSLVRLVDREFSTAGTGVGSAGSECFRWLALAKGIAPLRFIYKRQWETAAADEAAFRVSIDG